MFKTRDDWDHASKGSIGTSAVQITTSTFQCVKGMLIRADPANTGIVYIGQSDVTANSAAATDGLPLEAGDAVMIEVNQVNLVYAIASAAGQKVFWIAV